MRWPTRAGAAVLTVALLATAGAQAPAAGASEWTDRPFADAFDRGAGSDLGSGWSELRGDWAISGGAVVATGATERVLAHAEPLGATFAVSAAVTLTRQTPDAGDRGWAGLATNVTPVADGKQSYYALRVGKRPGEPAHWQLVRIHESGQATEESVLGRGEVTADFGTRVPLGLTSARNSTTLEVSVAGARTTVPLRQHDRLAGGFAGLYSQNGTTPIDDFTSTTTTEPAPWRFADDFAGTATLDARGWTAARGTWTVTAGRATAIPETTPPHTRDLVIYPRTVTLSGVFTVGATVTLPAADAKRRFWSGIAFNLTHSGTDADHYVLRAGRQSTDTAARYQLLRLTDGAVNGTPLLDRAFEAAPGSTLRLTVTARHLGAAVEIGIAGRNPDGTAVPPVADFASFPAAATLYGGKAGLYSFEGATGLDDFVVETTGRSAGVPPPLNCLAPKGTYPLPPAGTVQGEPVTVDRTWAGHSVEQSIITSGDRQYVAYYDANRRMTVAARTLGSSTWTYQPLESTLEWDSHNYVTMALDPAGQLHVSGNMHADPLEYFRTTTAGDVRTLVKVDEMVDTGREREVTYPRFRTTADGTLLFSYRDGRSGEGVTHYNRYDPATRTWTPLLSTALTDGQGLRSAYEEGPVRGPDGYWYLTLVWRDTIDAATSSRPSFMRSADLVTWEDIADQPIALPATYASADVIDPVPIFGGVLNGNVKTGWDAAGQVLITYSKYDANLVNQLYAARPDGAGGWTSTKLTDWTGHWSVAGTGSLADMPLRLLSGATDLGDGTLRIDYACRTARRSLIVDSADLHVVADVATPRLPAAITGASDGRMANLAVSGGYVLRWESLGANNDRPRPEWPEPQPLQVWQITP